MKLRGLPFDERWRLHPTTGCHVWIAACDEHGYGRYRGRGAHRFAWIRENGDVPAGLQLDHLCRNRGCVNPAHLEPVTQRENTMRSPIAPAAINARKTHCDRDHLLSGANLYVRSDGRRICRECLYTRTRISDRVRRMRRRGIA